MKIKGAIFDVDGTLLDSMYVWRHRGEIYLESLGITPREGLHLDVRQLGFIDSPKLIRDEYGLTRSDEEIRNGMLKVVDNYYKTSPVLKEGTVEFLEELRRNGVKMCVATATDRNMVEPGLINAGIRDYFDEIFTCRGLKTNKTKPLILIQWPNHFVLDMIQMISSLN